MTNDEMLQKMFELQEQLNVKIKGPDWRKCHLNWSRAIFVECAELLESFPWKWWKDTQPDEINQKIELIDILHFGMAQWLQVKSYPIIHWDEDPHQSEIISDIELIAKIALQDEIFDFNLFFGLCKKMNMTFPMVYKLYMGKQILNKFRQCNGYNEGTYIKKWYGTTGQGEPEYHEDNFYLFHSLEDIPVENIDHLYVSLKFLYDHNRILMEEMNVTDKSSY
jgi:dimeric dUTPase (all-alpha-NTP-PPase superfamily)